MKVGIVGAGFAGLSTAKELKSFGHDVTVFEKEADVGGVWSAARRYPGLTTQNVRSTYAFSDYPYPSDYPEWPSGEQVQRYLESYARAFGFSSDIELMTTVLSATPDADANGWTVDVRHAAGGAEPPGPATYRFDYLVVCNGIFSQPHVPAYAGADAFTSGGGRVCHTSEFANLADASGKHVLVVGYGKSSCDVAQAVAETAASTTVIARQVIWKVPKLLMGVLNYKFLLLTRMGEGLFRYIHLRGFEKFLHGAGNAIRTSMLGQVQWVITRQCKLDALDLNPELPFETIARSTVSLVTDGFFENVERGRIRVAKNTEIRELGVVDGVRCATLANGETIPADIIVCGTGWTQSVPFLDPALMARITDGDGNFLLYRSMLPVDVPRLAFNGYNSSFFSQLNAEIGSLWLAELLAGALRLPPADEQRRIIAERLAWMEERTEGKHAKGTNIIPFSVHHIDELLGDLRLPLDAVTQLKQWLLPIDPSDFAYIARALHARQAPVSAAPQPPALTPAAR